MTAGLVAYVQAVRPELMRADAEVMRPRGLAVSLAVAAVMAAVLSLMKSRLPDGLETVAARLSLPGRAAPLWEHGPMPGYAVPGVANETLAGILAGVVGVALAGVVLYLALQAARRRGTTR